MDRNYLPCIIFLSLVFPATLHSRAASEDSTSGSQILAESRSQGINDIWHQPFLSGSWGGFREHLIATGIEISFVAKADQLANTAGGKKRGAGFLYNLDLSAQFDGEKVLGWEGGSGFVHFLNNNGGSLNAFVGDVQMVSNIESPRQLKIYEGWIQQNLWGESFSILAGLYDLNTEFYSTRTSALFLNGSHGVGKELSQTGRNGPSIFPNTGLALRLRYRPTVESSVQLAAIDGAPGNPDDPSCPSLTLSADEGALIVGEASYVVEGEHFCKYTIGGWFYTSRIEEFNPSGAIPGAALNSGIYVSAEQMVLNENGSLTEGLSTFLRFGMAKGSVNQFDFHFGLGAVYTGLIPGRDNDQLGFAVAHAHNGSAFRHDMASQGVSVDRMEVSVELTYRAQITSWLAFQPDIQRIIHPGTDPLLPDALVVGVRVETRF